MRIALVAYGCEPDRGTELGVGWAWANEIRARGHDVVVYTHEDEKEKIEFKLNRHDPSLTFRYFRPGGWPLIHHNRVIHQVHYTLWQWLVIKELEADAKIKPYDLVHFITWGGVRMPVFGWRQTAPYVIGPVGGGEEAPLSYCFSLGMRVFSKEVVRNILNRLCLFDPILRKGYGGAARIYAKTAQSQRLIPHTARSRCDVVLEIGANPELLALPLGTEPVAVRPVRLIFVARLLHWKSPLTVVAAYAELLRRGFSVELTLVGHGPEEARLKAAIAALPESANVSHIRQLPQPELFALMQEQDVLLFPSLHDSSGNVVLEAMSIGLPVIALALGGPYELLRDGGGVLLPVERRTAHETTIAIADAVMDLASTREKLSAMKRAAKQRASQRTWACAIEQIYGPLEAAYGSAGAA